MLLRLKGPTTRLRIVFQEPCKLILYSDKQETASLLLSPFDQLLIRIPVCIHTNTEPEHFGVDSTWKLYPVLYTNAVCAYPVLPVPGCLALYTRLYGSTRRSGDRGGCQGPRALKTGPGPRSAPQLAEACLLDSRFSSSLRSL